MGSLDSLEKRHLKAELLDDLSPEDPAAVRSYRDLARINFLMGNNRFFNRTLRRLPRAESCLELGSGDGRLARYLHRQRPTTDFSLTGFDLKPRGRFFPSDWPWQQGNLLEDPWPSSTHIMANLILHHFSDDQLRQMAGQLKKAHCLVISEPARRSLHLGQMQLFRLLRPDPVTIHDADVSIRAGFRPGELPALLDLQPKEWTLTESLHPMGACRLIALRRHS